jgi:hypothetical protein
MFAHSVLWSLSWHASAVGVTYYCLMVHWRCPTIISLKERRLWCFRVLHAFAAFSKRCKWSQYLEFIAERGFNSSSCSEETGFRWRGDGAWYLERLFPSPIALVCTAYVLFEVFVTVLVHCPRVKYVYDKSRNPGLMVSTNLERSQDVCFKKLTFCLHNVHSSTTRDSEGCSRTAVNDFNPDSCEMFHLVWGVLPSGVKAALERLLPSGAGLLLRNVSPRFYIQHCHFLWKKGVFQSRFLPWILNYGYTLDSWLSLVLAGLSNVWRTPRGHFDSRKSSLLEWFP